MGAVIDGEVLLLAFGVVAKLVIVAAVGATAAKRPRAASYFAEDHAHFKALGGRHDTTLIVSTTGALSQCSCSRRRARSRLVTIGVGVLSMSSGEGSSCPHHNAGRRCGKLPYRAPNIVAIPLVALCPYAN